MVPFFEWTFTPKQGIEEFIRLSEEKDKKSLFWKRVIQSLPYFEILVDGETRFIFSPSTEKDYVYRMTWFDNQGPVMHQSYRSKEEAFDKLKNKLPYNTSLSKVMVKKN